MQTVFLLQLYAPAFCLHAIQQRSTSSIVAVVLGSVLCFDSVGSTLCISNIAKRSSCRVLHASKYAFTHCKI